MTKILTEQDPQTLKLASKILKNDGVICFATETVYALSCNASSDLAVKRLYEIKKRDPNKPIAIFTNDLKTAKNFLEFNPLEEAIAQKFMPGMITLILNKKPSSNPQKVSSLLNNNDENIGLRIPNHKFCSELLNEFDGIIAATSANISNHEAAINFEQALKYFQDKVDLVIDGGICTHKIASTVLKIEENIIQIIRPGLITKDQLENAKTN